MKGFCPSCEKETVLTRVRRVEDFTIKDERIAIDVDFFQCLECGQEFDNPDPGNDPLALANREYRTRMGMLQPEQIRDFRKTYDLSQRELSELIGFGGATLSRYENGALQDESHDRLLRLVMLPANLIKIVEADSRALSAQKRQALITRLHGDAARAELIGWIDRHGQYGEPNQFNGLKTLELARLGDAVKVLCCQSNVYKHRLARLLFYADFKHFKEYGAGFTGLCYTHLASGPAPDSFEIILAHLVDFDPDLTIDEDPALDAGGEFIRSGAEPDHGSLAFTELEVLLEVNAFFKPFTASRLRYFSSEEDGYLKTKTGELISYEYARRLRI